MFFSEGIPISSIVESFSQVIDFVDPSARNHHLRVALIASAIAREYGLSHEEISQICLASCFHDIGIFSLHEKIATLEFQPHISDINRHGELGYYLLKDIPKFNYIAKMIRYHHVKWEIYPYDKGQEEEIPFGCYIIHLADRIEVSIRRNMSRFGVNKEKEVVEMMEREAGKTFMPELVEVFKAISSRLGFWLDIEYAELEALVRENLPVATLGLRDMLVFGTVFSRVIDYRSPFTAVHSIGVSSVGTKLAEIYEFSPLELKLMTLAGLLHDIGKLAVPSEILEKPGRLDPEEWVVMKSHAYYSFRILEKLKGLRVVNFWGSLHHERLNGSGYPFKLKEDTLLLGSKILAIADVYTAISEDRPYRKGMNKRESMKVLKEMASSGVLDPSIVKRACEHIDELNEVRKMAQEKAHQKYEETVEKLGLR